MVILPTVNRRDKAVLFFTLTAVGLMLVHKTAISKALGVAILGLALIWAVGHGCRLATLPKLNRRHKSVLLFTLLAAGLSLTLGLGLKFSLGAFILGLALAWVVGSDRRSVHNLLLLCGIALVTRSVIVERREYVHRIAEYNGLTATYLEHRAAYSAQLREFRSQLPRLAKRYPLDKDVLSEPPFSIIDPLAVGPQVKADAYRAFYDSAEYYDFKAHFDKIDIPEKAKVELYKAKAGPLLPLDLPSPLPEWAADALAAGVDLVSWHGSGMLAVENLLTPELSVGPIVQPAPFTARLEEHVRKLLPGLFLTVLGIVLLIGSSFGRERPTSGEPAVSIR